MNQDGLDHNSRSGLVIMAGVVSSAIATIATVLRLFTRFHINHQVGVDDWSAIISWLCALGMAVSQSINASKYLGRHQYDLDITVDFPAFLVNFWVTEIFYNAALLFIKMTFLLQYFRVFRQIRSMRITYIVSMIAITIWNAGQLFAVVFTCYPISGVWDRTIQARCQDQQLGVYLNAAGNLTTDICIILLPLPSLWHLNLPKSQRWAVLGIFGIGIITCVISVVRITAIGGSGDDLTYDTVTSACLSVAELGSGITCAAFATLRPFATRMFPSAFSKSYIESNEYRYTRKYPHHNGSDDPSKKWRRTRDNDSVLKESSAGERDWFRGAELGFEMNTSSGGQPRLAGGYGTSDTALGQQSGNASVDDIVRGHRTLKSSSSAEVLMDHEAESTLAEALGLKSACATNVTCPKTRNHPGSSVGNADKPYKSAIIVERKWMVHKSDLPPILSHT